MIMQRNALHLKGIRLNAAKKDLKIKNGLIKTVKLLKHLVKYKEHSFRETMLQRISQLESNDPKTFWEMLKKLKTHRDENLTDNIDPLEWQEWFKKP